MNILCIQTCLLNVHDQIYTESLKSIKNVFWNRLVLICSNPHLKEREKKLFSMCKFEPFWEICESV